MRDDGAKSVSEETTAATTVQDYEAGRSSSERNEATGPKWLELLKWAFSFPALLGTGLVGVVCYLGSRFTVDPDFWWHLKVGQAILATHHWPTTDVYSFTVYGQPWVAEEWLGEVVGAWFWRLGGIRGLDFLLMTMGAATILGLYVLASIRSNAKAGFLATALLCPLFSMSYSLRPQMLAYTFLVVTLIALELFRAGKKWPIWILPPMFLVWVNTHGLWLIGLGVVLLYWVAGLVEFRMGAIEAKRWTASERKQISFVFLLSVAATATTPYGTELAGIPFRFMFSLPLLKANVDEWLPMSFSTGVGQFFLILFLGFFVLQIIYDFRWRVEELALVLGAFALTCFHARFVLLFVPFFTPHLARWFARWVEPYDRSIDKYALNGILMAATAVAMIHYFPSTAALNERLTEKFPVKAVEYLRQHPVPGPMFDNSGFGGYLIWELGPEQKVFIDGRDELYEQGGVLSDFLRASLVSPGGLDVLRRYQIRACLLKTNMPMGTALSMSRDWEKVYSDEMSELFVRRRGRGTSTGEAGGEAAR